MDVGWISAGPENWPLVAIVPVTLTVGKSYEDKFVFGICADDEMVGVVDLIRGYPDDATAMIGSLLVSERHRQQGIGKRAYELVEEGARGWPRCKRL